MNISMDKKYTLNGKAYTVLTVTMPGPYSVVGHTQSGEIYLHKADGVEVSLYADFVVDEKVMVRDFEDQPWVKRVFRGVELIRGYALAYHVTQLVDTGPCPTSWRQCRRPTTEELTND